MSRRMLVADDSSTIQKVIKIAFSRHDLEIVEAASLIEAFAAVSRTTVDILILDASLPGAHGPEDFAKLKSEAAGAPALLLAGTYDSIDEAAFKAAGFAHFLKKPFESADIISVVEGLVSGFKPVPEKMVRTTPEHPTMIVPGGAFDPTRPPPEHLFSSEVGAPPVVPTVSLDEEAPAVPPPPPVIDHARKGRRAFGEGESTQARAPGMTAVPDGERREETRHEMAPEAPRVAGKTTSKTMSGTSGVGANLDLGMSAPFGGSPMGASAGPLGTEPGVPRPAGTARSLDLETAREEILTTLEEQLPALVRQVVEEYCERHFKSLAREVIATELRRLADEKARHLVDN